MTISLTNTGKRFNREWIFRHLNFEFSGGNQYVITGPNGSGKSTLLQVIAGAIALSEGNINYTLTSGKKIEPDAAFKQLSIAAPYLELIEEMTLQEFLDFHCNFKPLLPGATIPSIVAAVGLEKALKKQIRFFSSGMKQRIKLAQAIFSDTELLLLDEPCTNLDADGIAVYHHLIETYCLNRLVIVSSNDEVEYRFCKEAVDITKYK